MYKSSTITKAANKAVLSLVYFLFFTVQLHFQYQSASSVDFSDTSISARHSASLLHAAHKSELKEDISFTKHNRLNKRYHPEWPIAIVDFFDTPSFDYQIPAKQFFSSASVGSNIFLSTYLLRGPPRDASCADV